MPNQVLLNWQTAAEINLSYFNVQRSVNGKDFINTGIAKASNKNYNEYSFTDVQLPISTTTPLTIYYRLESVDNDGRKQYSEVKQVQINGLTNKQINVYPNPAKEYIMNESSQPAKELFIIDNMGRTIKHYNNITQRQIINTKQLSKGIYTVKLMLTNGSCMTEKLIVQ